MSDGIAHLFARYFRGILFLTTNRVKTFDQAFQSRIHLSLHYSDLTCAAKEEIWRAFLDKVRTTQHKLHNLTQDELQELSAKDMNGRQIKNVVKLAVVLAEQENEPLGFKHLVRMINTIKDNGFQRMTG
jgi:AAA+ superfamily predicted ATPase